MRLGEALGIGEREVISLVGGGGKTTLMFALARELACAGRLVVTTTTTRILESEPAAHGSPRLILEEDGGTLLRAVAATPSGHVTVAAGRLPGQGKLKGIRPETVDGLAELPHVTHVIVEADGAAHRPLKAPNETEPVIPGSTTLVIAVVGIDAIGLPLCEENVFRPDVVSRLTGLRSGEVVTADTVAVLITHTEGIARGSPASARIVPFVNKTDLGGGLLKAGAVAREVLRRGHPRISRVVLGRARDTDPVSEVFTAVEPVALSAGRDRPPQMDGSSRNAH